MNAGHYAAFGLHIESALPLPDLPAIAAGSPDLVITLATLTEAEDRAGYHVTGDAALLVVPGVARFRIVGGREIAVEPAPGVAAREVVLFVLGSAMGAVLHQRGLLPLHANAIGVRDGAIALLGHSGAGKSTLARWFHDRGAPVLSDDVCAVGGDGFALPGIPRLRLWRDALERSGRDPANYDRSYEGADKFDVPITAADLAPRRLRALYLLGRGDRAAIAPLTGARAVAALVGNTYRGSYVAAAGLAATHLATCVALARRVPVFTFTRSWAVERFDADAAVLVAHAESLATR